MENKTAPHEFKRIAGLYSPLGKKVFRIVLPVFFIVIIYLTSRQELHSVDLGRTLYLLRGFPKREIIIIFVAGIIAVAASTLYDIVIAQALSYQISRKKIFKIAWVAATFNNFLGFAGLTGPAVRIFFYKSQGIETKDILKLTALLVTTALTGLSGLAAAVAAGLLDAGQSFQVYPSLRWLVIGMAAYLPLFILVQCWPWLAAKVNLGTTVRPKFVFGLVAVSHLQWLAAGSFFWLVAELLDPRLTLSQGLGIYTVSVVVGVLSLTPGGIGSMDMVLLIILQRFGISAGDSLSIILLFRANYFLFPWIVGLIFSVISLLPASRILPEKGLFAGEVADSAVAALVFLSGVILLLSAATAGLTPRLVFIGSLFPEKLIRFSHHLSVAIGILLMVLSRRIHLKMRGAYFAALYLLMLGAVFTFLKGLNYEEALFLLFVAYLLWLSRVRFTRENGPVDFGRLFYWFLLTSGIVYLYSRLGANVYAHLRTLPLPDMVKGFLMPVNEFKVGAYQSLVVSWLVFGLWLTLSPGRPKKSTDNKKK